MPTEGFSRFYNRSSSHMLKAMGFAGNYVETSQGRIHYYQAKGSGRDCIILDCEPTGTDSVAAAPHA